MPDFKQVTTEHDFAAVADLAREIWTEHYVRIVGWPQIDYMLDKFQSVSAIARQTAEGYCYYLLLDGMLPIGYFALVPDADRSTALLSKLYVRKEERGRGLGKAMVAYLEQLCRDWSISTLWLTVNKNNANSIAWYEHVGFLNRGPIVQDIGGGFVMDDYRMEKAVPTADSRRGEREGQTE